MIQCELYAVNVNGALDWALRMVVKFLPPPQLRPGVIPFPQAEHGLLRQAHLLQQINVTGIVMPLMQDPDDFDGLHSGGFFGTRFIQPGKGLLFVAEGGVQVGDFGGVLVAAFAQFLPHFDFAGDGGLDTGLRIDFR